MAGKIQNQLAQAQKADKPAAQPNVTALLNTFLDRDGLRKRFDELLGKRSPQFMSSIVSMVNADKNMQQAFYESPMTVIQAALKAATFDLPIDQSLGYAYIVPFKNYKKDLGTKKMEASFILGWKGMHQLALRTGAYKTINVVDIREGELKKYNRLTEEVEIDFIEDENEREKHPVIGYVGYYRLVNGAEKTIYMSVKAIESHERKHRKGEYQGKGWRDDWDAMARKTVYRILIGKWGVMSIDYQTADEGKLLADVMAEDAQTESIIDAEYSEIPVNEETGEVIEQAPAN
jgi:recombination protein RecT